MSGQKKKTVLALLFALYLTVLLVLLFHRAPREGYNYNLVPFLGIKSYFLTMAMHNPETKALQIYGWVNFLGNIFAFFPLGLLLPLLFGREKSFPFFLLTAAAAICAVELLQLWTHRGALDVDDLILNLPGSCLGWLCSWLMSRKTEQ